MTADLAPFAATVSGTVVRGMRGGRGPVALLLHGTAGSWRNFRPWLPTLLSRCHAVIPDLPGFGDSPVPSLKPRLATWAALLHALVAALGTPPRLLVGLGLGASLALAYLKDAPAAAGATPLTGLVLHTPAFHPGAIRPAVRWGVRLATAPIILPIASGLVSRPGFRDWFVRHFTEGPGMAPDEARALREDVHRASVAVLGGLVRDMVGADFRPLLRTLPAPTLAIVSQRDPFVYAAEVERLPALMPRATVVVQPDLAHGWSPDAIAEQNRVLARFLDGLDAEA